MVIFLLLLNGVTQTFAQSCDRPEAISFIGINDNSASISWNNNPIVGQYKFQYRITGSSDSWTTATVSGNGVNLTGLSENTSYDYRLRSECDTINSNYRKGTFHTHALPCTTEVFIETFESNFFFPFPSLLILNHIRKWIQDCPNHCLVLTKEMEMFRFVCWPSGKMEHSFRFVYVDEKLFFFYYVKLNKRLLQSYIKKKSKLIDI